MIRSPTRSRCVARANNRPDYDCRTQPSSNGPLDQDGRERNKDYHSIIQLGIIIIQKTKVEQICCLWCPRFPTPCCEAVGSPLLVVFPGCASTRIESNDRRTLHIRTTLMKYFVQSFDRESFFCPGTCCCFLFGVGSTRRITLVVGS